MARTDLPLPPHFDPDRVGEVWRVLYQERADQALVWAKEHGIRPAAQDRFRICLVAVDIQNTFCIPGFELFVGGRSGTGAVDDNRRLCQFLYRNLDIITHITTTMDTHQAIQIFHALYLVDDRGRHPPAHTLITEEDLEDGRWRFNPVLAPTLDIDPDYGDRHLRHYARRLRATGKYDLTVWPYHAMLGGIGHALVSAVEESFFFHSVARYSRPEFHTKGDHPLTEAYSALGPEVLEGPDGESIAHKSELLLQKAIEFDAVIIAGQAKSHCVAWTVEDLLQQIQTRDQGLAGKIYLLDDCATAIYVEGVLDYTDQAEAAYQRFAEAGMHVVRSTDPIDSWPGLDLA